MDDRNNAIDVQNDMVELDDAATLPTGSKALSAATAPLSKLPCHA